MGRRYGGRRRKRRRTEGGPEIKVEGGKRGIRTKRCRQRRDVRREVVGLTESQGNNGQPAERRQRECTFCFFSTQPEPSKLILDRMCQT